MKKSIFTIVMAVCITSLGFASETNKSYHKTNSDAITAYKTSPFCMAIVKGDQETVKKLIELGIDVNEKSDGMTPLMYAARYNRTDIIKILVEKGAEINTKNSKGYTAMKFAKQSNAKEAVALLEELS